MPYKSIAGAKEGGFPTSADGIPLTLEQINQLAEIYDAVKKAGTADNPMAVAWYQWKQLYKKKDDKWIRKEIKAKESETTEKYHHINQTDSEQYIRFRIIELKPGINAVIGFKKEGGSEIQSYLFDIDKFTIEQAKAWVKEHGGKIKTSERFNYLTELPASIFQEAPPTMTEIQILRVGRWKHTKYGSFEITKEDLKLFKENFDNKVRRIDIAVDTEHFPEKGAAGWIKQLILKGMEELWALVEWTQWGIEAIKGKLFQYISPEFDFEYKDEETGERYKNVLYGIALTNRPFIKEMSPVVLSENLKEKFIFAEEIKEKKEGGDKEMELKKLIEALKLSETATEEDVLKKIEELMVEKPSELKEIKETLKLKEDAKVEDIVAKIKEFSGKVTLTESEVKELRDNAEAGKKASEILKLKECEELVNGAINQGKISSKQKDWGMDYAKKDKDGFVRFVESASKVIDFTERGTEYNNEGEMKASEEINKLVKEKMEKDKGLTFAEAVRIVSGENPELAKRYEEETLKI